jgi:ESS family glutamate:Na+ symporter
VIGGFLVLALGPEGVGRLTGGGGVFSTSALVVWKALPGVLINVMCAALLLGEQLPAGLHARDGRRLTVWGLRRQAK